MSTCDLMCLSFCQTESLAERDGRVGEDSCHLITSTHQSLFFFFDFQPGLAKMPGSGLNGDGGGESDMSIKRGQGVFQPDVDLQDGVSSFLRSPRLSD